MLNTKVAPILKPTGAMIFTSILIVLCMIAINTGCKTENHIDKHQVNLDSLQTLPDGFYAFRRGRVYLEDVNTEEFRIWFNRDSNGNVETIFNIEDFKDKNANRETTMLKYGIDTFDYKAIMQKFIYLSRKYKFGHISIDRSNKISFSYKDGLSEQYVKTFNDSLEAIYKAKNDFILLNNGWFEYSEK
ncbi:MAG: hypothetical protein V4685_06580 [Bacteroidota bacterium]